MKNKVKNLVYAILNDLSKQLGIKRKNIKIEIKDYKRKIASVNIKKGIIRIKKSIINDDKLLEKVIKHELLHIKYNTRWHTKEFFDELKKL